MPFFILYTGVFLLLEQLKGWRKNSGCLVCAVVTVCLGTEIVISKVFAATWRKPGISGRYFRSGPFELGIFIWVWKGSRRRKRGYTKQDHVLAMLYLPALEWWGACPKGFPSKEGKNFYGEWYRGPSGWVFHGWSVRSDTWSSSGLSFPLFFIALLRGQKDFLLSKKLTMYPGLWKGCGLMGQAHSDRGAPSRAEMLYCMVRGQHPVNPADFWLLPLPSSIKGIRIWVLFWGLVFFSSWLTCPVTGTDPEANVCSGVSCPCVTRKHWSGCLHITPTELWCTFTSE